MMVQQEKTCFLHDTEGGAAMEAYRDDEMELDLKDLVFYMLMRWRFFILFAVACSALFGGISALRGMRTLKNAEAVQEAGERDSMAKEQYELSKEVLTRQIAAIQEEIETQEAYKANSILMNIDPYEVYRVSRIYYISTDYQIIPGAVYQDVNPATSILNIYASVAKDGEFPEKIYRAAGGHTTAQDLKELIQVNADAENQLLTVTAKGADASLPTALISCIEEALKDSQNTISETIGAHEITQVEETSGFTMDTELSDMLSKMESKVTDLQNNLAKKQEELLKLKKPSDHALNLYTVRKKTLKRGILGFFGGGFLALVCLLLYYALSDYGRRSYVLEKRFGLRVIMNLYEPEKRSFSFLDRFFLRILRPDFKETGDTLATLGARIRVLNQDKKEVDVIGNLEADALQGLVNRLKESGVSQPLHVLGNVYENTCDDDFVKNNHTLLWVADIEKGDKTELIRLLEDMAWLGKENLGIVAVYR